MAPKYSAATKAKRERKKLIKDTIKKIRQHEFQGVSHAERVTGLSKATLSRRLRGSKPCNQAHEEQQILSRVEEKELARWITLCTVAGHAPILTAVKEMAEGIRRRRVKEINELGMELITYEPIGKRWVGRFLKRFPHLQSEMSKRIEAVRLEPTAQEYQKYFDDLRDVINEFDVLPENIYNMDETGFNIGTIEDRHVIVDSTVIMRYQS
jgi:Txe/YoeB family toxin of Txe-Axe toxin-antitoxin module